MQIDHSLLVSWAHCGHTSKQDRLVYPAGRRFGDARCHVPVAVEGRAHILVPHHALDDLDVLTLLLEQGPGTVPERVKGRYAVIDSEGSAHMIEANRDGLGIDPAGQFVASAHGSGTVAG